MSLKALSFMDDASRSPALIEMRRSVSCDLLAGLAPQTLTDLDPIVERLAPGSEFMAAGRADRRARILLQGWVARQWTLNDGRRQITGFMIAGDAGACWTPLERPIRDDALTLTPCLILSVQAERLAGLVRDEPEIKTRIRRADRAEMAILTAWLVNLGQRKAPERIAHLLCELDHRQRRASQGETPVASLLPLTQQDVADALGMTSIHVNRLIQRLRGKGLIEVRKGAVIVRDPRGLAAFCEFDRSYLEVNQGWP